VSKQIYNPTSWETPSGVTIVLLHNNFQEIKKILEQENIPAPTGVYYDL